MCAMLFVTWPEGIAHRVRSYKGACVTLVSWTGDGRAPMRNAGRAPPAGSSWPRDQERRAVPALRWRCASRLFAAAYLRWSAVASRAARNSESLLQPGHWSELASLLPTV